jgi:ubiquinone/menaquinone biosynthesis C-methylase UbiE
MRPRRLRHISRAVVVFLGALATVLVAGPAHAQLANRTAEEWISTLDSSQRVQSLKINETIEKLGIKGGQVVADIGAGSGVFSIPLAPKVRPGGKVYAVDVDEALLAHISETATEQGIVNIETVYGEYDDPVLPASVDLAFINDVLHHIEHRDVYLKNLAKYLKPGGRVAIIDFKPGQGGHANDPSLQVSQEQATAWMAAAGLKPVQEVTDLFTDKWFVIYAKQ